MMMCGCSKCGKKVNLLLLAARIFLSAVFVYAAFNKATNFAGAVGFVGSMGVPLPEFMTVIAILVEVIGSLALLIGFHVRVAAMLLAFFTVVATLVAHRDLSNPMQVIEALKNLGIIGGLLQLKLLGGGAWKVPQFFKCASKMCPDCSAQDCGCCKDARCSSCDTQPQA